MPWNPKIPSLCAWDQLARTVLCQLPSGSAQHGPDLSPGPQLLPRLPLMAASGDGDKPTPSPSFSAKPPVSQWPSAKQPA